VSARTTVSAALALLSVGAFTGVASAVPAKGEADLRLTIAYRQAEYQPNADLEATVTVENVGTATAEGLTFSFDGNCSLPSKETEKLTSLKRLEPGEKKSEVLIGKQRNANEVTGTLTAKVGIAGVVDPTPADNEASATVKIVKAVGVAHGTAGRPGPRVHGRQRRRHHAAGRPRPGPRARRRAHRSAQGEVRLVFRLSAGGGAPRHPQRTVCTQLGGTT